MIVFLKSIRYLFCAIILLGICIWAYSAAFQNRQVLQKIDVAVVVPEENAEALQFLTDLVSAMQSVKSVCHFQYMDKEDAVEELQEGDIQAILVFSKHLYEDLDLGRNTSVQLYVSQEDSTSVQMFQELLKDGISMIWTAEAGVYAILDQASPDIIRQNYEDVGTSVAVYYLKAALGRTSFFDEKIASPYGIYGQREYLFSTGILWMLLLTGLSFSTLYRGKNYVVESKLRAYGIGPWKIACVNVFAMSNMLMIVAGGGYVAGCIFTNLTYGTFLFFDIRVLIGLYVLCLVLATWHQAVFAVTERSGMGLLALLACEGILALGSGWIVPIAYLPKTLQQISVWLPLYQWNQCSMNLLFGSISWWEIGCMVFWLLSGGAIGVMVTCKKR